MQPLNGYIYYAPTIKQLQHVGDAQEDSDCILAPHRQAIYELEAAKILDRLKAIGWLGAEQPLSNCAFCPSSMSI